MSLPPIAPEQFDGYKEQTTVVKQTLDISKIYYDKEKRELRHPNGAAWGGPGLDVLLKEIKKQK